MLKRDQLGGSKNCHTGVIVLITVREFDIIKTNLLPIGQIDKPMLILLRRRFISVSRPSAGLEFV